MIKRTTSRKTPKRGEKRTNSITKQRKAMEETLAKLDALVPETPKIARLIALLRSWVTDESGYAERTWPKLKKALNDERDRVGARRLFDD